MNQPLLPCLAGLSLAAFAVLAQATPSAPPAPSVLPAANAVHARLAGQRQEGDPDQAPASTSIQGVKPIGPIAPIAPIPPIQTLRGKPATHQAVSPEAVAPHDTRPKIVIPSLHATPIAKAPQVATGADDIVAAREPGAAPKAPALLAHLMTPEDVVYAKFPTEVPGVTGYLINRDGLVGQPAVAYTLADGSVLLGGLFTRDPKTGEPVDLTHKYLTQYAAKPDLAKLWGQVTKTHFIREGASDGQAKATIYAFFDPNCIFCHIAWKLSQPYLRAGLQIRWIPVAFLAPDSRSKAAGILSASNPSHVFSAGEEGWKSGMADGGGAFPEATVTEAIAAQLKSNKALFANLGISGTPGFVYRDAKGQVHVRSGVSNQHLFTDMTGLPFIKNTDPALARIPQ